jgi:hypothetical protein
VCVAGDFDGDGQVDLCVGGGTAIDTRVYWNSNGTFSNSTVISTGRDTRSLAAGDLDGDGRLDIVEGNYGQQSNAYLNSASGFGAAIPFGGATEPIAAIAISDLDGDGNLDVRSSWWRTSIVTCSRAIAPLSWRLSKGWTRSAIRPFWPPSP